MKNILALIKVAFFFPLCWVLGGTFVSVVVSKMGLANPWPYFVYFAVGIGGTVWFAKS